MHVIGQCPKSCHHLAGPKAVPRQPEVGGQELADGLVKLIGHLVNLNFRGHVDFNGRGLLAGRVEAPEHQVAEAGCGDGGSPGLHRVTRAAVRASGSLETYSSSGPPCASTQGTCSITFTSDRLVVTVTVAVSRSRLGVHAPVTVLIAWMLPSSALGGSRWT